MKNTKKIVSLLAALMLVFTMGLCAFAASNDGSITITPTSNVSLTGKTFKAYKILDAELTNGINANDGIAYKVPTALADFYADELTLDKTDADFDVQVANAISASGFDLQAFAKDALAAAKAASISGVTGSASGANYVISSLPLGYYVVEDTAATTPVSALALNTTAKSVQITVKADKPTVDKVINIGSGVKYNNAAIGDDVPFKITTSVPSMVGYEKYYFVLEDTLSSGLTFNNDVVVTLGGTTLTANTDYTVVKTDNANGSADIEIVFADFIQYADNTGDDIVVTYSAKVDTDAVIGVSGNPNTAYLIYSNNPNVAADSGTATNPDKPLPTSSVDESAESTTYTYVIGIRITKVNTSNATLANAEFSISPKGSATVLDSGITTADGLLTFTGLAAGEYVITEITPPSGYNPLPEPIEVKITWAGPTSTSTDCTWTALVDGTPATVSDMVEVRVVNSTGNELPSTGGIGTTIFYVLGGLLIAAAVIIFVVRKRMSYEK